MIRIRATSTLLMLATLPVLFGYPIFSTAYSEERLNVDELAEDFFCTCGCNLLLSVCETQMLCDVASNMKLELGAMIDQGMSRDEIVESMISRYGNTVLALPPMRGFTLTLWWYPVIGAILGVLVITLVSRRRSGVGWRIDPDEVVALNEEELLEQIEIDESESTSAATKKYDDLLRERLKKTKK